MSAAIFRGQTALQHLRGFTEQQTGVMEEWLRLLGEPAPLFGTPPQLNFITETALEQVQLQLHLESKKDLATRYLDFMKTADFPAAEQKLFVKVLKGVKKGRLDCWLEIKDFRQFTGWALNGPLPLKIAQGLIPKTEDKERFFEVLEANEINAFVRFAHEVAAERYSYLQVALPGLNIRDNILIYQDFMEQLDLQALPDALLEQLISEAPEELLLGIALAPQGAIYYDLQIADPSPDMLMRMQLVFAEDSIEERAQLEVKLNASPQALSLKRDADGISVWSHYPVANTISA